MNIPVKVALVIGIIGGGISVCYLIYDQTVLKMARKENEKFEEIFQEQKDLLKSLQIKELDLQEDPATAAPKINKWCENELKKTDSKKKNSAAFLYVCKSKTSKIKDLISNWSEKKFIENEEDYGPSLFALKKSVQNDEENEKLAAEITDNKKLKKWCEEQLNKVVIDKNVHSLVWVDFLCRIQQTDTVEKEIRLGEDENDAWKITSDWEGTFEKWKNENKFIDLLKAQDSLITKLTPKAEAGKILKEWCESSLKRKLTGEINEEFVSHVEFACSGKSPVERNYY